MAWTDDARWGSTMKSDDFLDDDLQNARERAARAKERHRLEEEQKRRRTQSRRKSDDSPEEAEDVPVEVSLPGLDGGNPAEPEEDWSAWGMPPEATPPEEAPPAVVSEETPVAAADTSGATVAEPRREEPAVTRELHQRYDEKQAQLRRLREEIDRVERERRHLEALKRRQGDYEASKAQVAEQLRRGQAEMARELIQTEELAECLKTTRGRFETLLSELEAIREEEWSNEALEQELAEAGDHVARAREEVTRAQARLKVLRPEFAAGGTPAEERPGEATAAAADAVQPAAAGAGPAIAAAADDSFGRLLRRSFVYSLPGMATATLLFLLWLLFQWFRAPYY